MADEEVTITKELETAGQELEQAQQENKALLQRIVAKDSDIGRLEKELAERNLELETVKLTVTNAEKKLEEGEKILAQAIAGYKSVITEVNPEIPPELVTGDTIDAVNQSVANAMALVDRIKQGIEEDNSKTRVPLGAPQRSPLDVSALSAREKIQYAISAPVAPNR